MARAYRIALVPVRSSSIGSDCGVIEADVAGRVEGSLRVARPLPISTGQRGSGGTGQRFIRTAKLDRGDSGGLPDPDRQHPVQRCNFVTTAGARRSRCSRSCGDSSLQISDGEATPASICRWRKAVASQGNHPVIHPAD